MGFLIKTGVRKNISYSRKENSFSKSVTYIVFWFYGLK